MLLLSFVIIVLVLSLVILIIFRWLVQKGQITESASDMGTDDHLIVGDIGLSITKLIPVGKAKFGDKTYIVEGDNQFIEIEEKIKIIDIQGNKIVVEKI